MAQWSAEEDKTLADAVRVQSFPDWVWVWVKWVWVPARRVSAALTRDWRPPLGRASRAWVRGLSLGRLEREEARKRQRVKEEVARTS